MGSESFMTPSSAMRLLISSSSCISLSESDHRVPDHFLCGEDNILSDDLSTYSLHGSCRVTNTTVIEIGGRVINIYFD